MGKRIRTWGPGHYPSERILGGLLGMLHLNYQVRKTPAFVQSWMMCRGGRLCSSRHWVRSTGRGNEATAPAYRLAREAGHTRWLMLWYPPRLRICLPFYRRPSACLTETHEDLQERPQQHRELSEPQTGDPPVPVRRWAMEEAWSVQRTEQRASGEANELQPQHGLGCIS